MHQVNVGPKDYRKFGFLFAAIFGVVLGIALPLYKHHPINMQYIAVGAALLTISLVAPSVLKYPYKAWMSFSEALGFVNSRIILAVLFFGVITPISFIAKIFEKKPVVDQNTHRIESKKRTPQSMERTY